MGETTDAANVQTVFLNEIRKKLPDNVSFADELAEILNVSRDSAYRRIRGETDLSLDEVKKLYDQYGISFDAIISPNSNMVLIDHQAIGFNYSLMEWLKSLIGNLEQAKSSKVSEIIYAAKDMPVFHYFQFPELTTFKLFVWSKSLMKDSHYEHLQYSPTILPKEILAEAARAWQIYSSIPSTEIWSDEVINGTLKQIEFYHECDFFTNRSMITNLYDQLIEFINNIKREAAEGKKSEGGALTLYQNEILIPDNTIFAKIHNQRLVYINYNTMDLLTTQQESFCERTEVYMNNLIKNSALISATAEKERNRFFNKVEEKIMSSKANLR